MAEKEEEMTYRFVLQDVHPAFVIVHDKLKDCQWVLSLQFWFCINTTELDSDKNELITDALMRQALKCILSS
jgi:hypothetical protein